MKQVNLNRKFISSPVGIIRVLIILVQLSNWAAVASAPKATNDQSARDASLFFIVVGLILSILFYLVYFFNNKIPIIVSKSIKVLS
jgi:hypothetical protein